MRHPGSVLLALLVAFATGFVPWRTCLHEDGTATAGIHAHHHHGHEHCDGTHEEGPHEHPAAPCDCLHVPLDVGVPWAPVALAAPPPAGFRAELAPSAPDRDRGAVRAEAPPPDPGLESVVLLL